MCSHYSKFKTLHKHNEDRTQVLAWVRLAHKTHATKLHLVEVPQIWLSIFRSWKENSVCGYFWGRFSEKSDVVTLITYYEHKLDINNMSSEIKGGVCHQIPCGVCRPQQSISASKGWIKSRCPKQNFLYGQKKKKRQLIEELTVYYGDIGVFLNNVYFELLLSMQS